jgi:hypothetical protein
MTPVLRVTGGEPSDPRRRSRRGLATIRDQPGQGSFADPGHGGQDEFALTSERHHNGETRSPEMAFP